jgi:hypothetical protein
MSLPRSPNITLFDVALAEEAARDTGLVRHDDALEAHRRKQEQRLDDAVEDAHARGLADEARVFHQRSVAIQERCGSGQRHAWSLTKSACSTRSHTM